MKVDNQPKHPVNACAFCVHRPNRYPTRGEWCPRTAFCEDTFVTSSISCWAYEDALMRVERLLREQEERRKYLEKVEQVALEHGFSSSEEFLRYAAIAEQREKQEQEFLQEMKQEEEGKVAMEGSA